LLDFFFPSPLHPLWGEWSARAHATMRPVAFWTIAPGYGVLALAALGCWAAWRQARRWLLLVIGCAILSLGPTLRVAGINTELPMPYDLLKVLPAMQLAHRPNHMAIFLLPLLGVLAGYGMAALLERGRPGRATLALLGAVAL